jgi:hypothetical protein
MSPIFYFTRSYPCMPEQHDDALLRTPAADAHFVHPFRHAWKEDA